MPKAKLNKMLRVRVSRRLKDRVLRVARILEIDYSVFVREGVERRLEEEEAKLSIETA